MINVTLKAQPVAVGRRKSCLKWNCQSRAKYPPTPSNGVKMGSGRHALGFDVVIARVSSDGSVSAKWSKGFWTRRV